MMPCRMLMAIILISGMSIAKAQATPLALPGGPQMRPGEEMVELGRVRLAFSLNGDGVPQYRVWYGDKPVIQTSTLGFVLKEDSAFYRGFVLAGTDRKTVDENWEPVWGETRTIRNHYQECTAHLRQAKAPYRQLDIVFRVFEDGVGFRYRFPKQPDLKYFTVSDELTRFNLAGDHTAFWIPGDYDTNEYPYTTSKISEINNSDLVARSTDIAVRIAPDPYAVQTPLMMKSREGLYLNIHEAALVDYPAMQLHVDGKALSLSSSLVPDAVGNKAYLHAPCATPWRTIIVADKATEILASKMILNLNEPSLIYDPSWIHPMKFVGVWWEMQTGKSTWSYSDFPDSILPANKASRGGGMTRKDGTAHMGTYMTGTSFSAENGLLSGDRLIPNGRHGANTANVKKYIDFAAANHIQGVLVEGWNVGWEDWFGNWKENVFDFVTPYPDFNVQELITYATSKGVSLIMHNETSGAATNYERQMDTAFRFMGQMGYHAVKTGYVGRIIPRGEHHDGQWMVGHYVRVAEKAARYHVMLDAHEPVRPTGLQRTYPNWLACEAGRGNEYNAFSNGNAPEHETILPFTRLMGGPMDYTPGIFKIRGYSSVPGRQVHTTLAKQLALYVTLYSPLQMAADLPENYEAHKDAFQFIRDVPVDWDDTKILEAEPGDFITIARREKGADNWYIGAITDEHTRVVNISLDFLQPGKKYQATIYKDGENADWKENPEAYMIESRPVSNGAKLSVKLAPGGGMAVSIKPI